MSLPLIPSILMGKHSHHSSDGVQSKKATQHGGSSLLGKALRRGRGSCAPPPQQQPAQRSEKPTSTPVQPHDTSRPVRARVPAVTSKARTTAPEKDTRANRRKYPSTMRQRLH